MKQKLTLQKKAVFTPFLLLLFTILSAQTIPSTINSSGIYSSFSGSDCIMFEEGYCYQVTIQAWGAGGGGGGAFNGTGGGGGGAAYAQVTFTAIGGNSYCYSIGIGGAGGTNGGNGTAGGATWFNTSPGVNNNTTGLFLSATGGPGGYGGYNAAGTYTSSMFGVSSTFGTGLTGTFGMRGGPGTQGVRGSDTDGGGGGGGGGAGSNGEGGGGGYGAISDPITCYTDNIITGYCMVGAGAGGGAAGGPYASGWGPLAAGFDPNGTGEGTGGTGGNPVTVLGEWGTGGGFGATTSGTPCAQTDATAAGNGTTAGAGGGGGAGSCGGNGSSGANGADGGSYMDGYFGGGGGGGGADGGNGGHGGDFGGGGGGASYDNDGSPNPTGIGGNGGNGYLLLTVVAVPFPTPEFTAVSPICVGATLAPLPTTSNNGITGTWSPGLNNMATTTYTFTPTEGQCATNTTLTIAVNPTPTFAPVLAICAGETLASLPTTSIEGITGSWLPALNNTTTTTYTFTPDTGQCATAATLTITVNPIITPVFTPVAAICPGETLAALPTTSNNGITGTWSPALNNMVTTTYTFTPTTGQCAPTATLTITVNQGTTPTFTPVAAICPGETPAALPTTSNNGITGSWSPALNSTSTTTYTFTPTAGQCAATTTLTITVNQGITPTFTPVTAICSGEIPAALPVTSNNGISGTWSPALNNTVTTTYTFTPTEGQCATTTTLTITVSPNITPTFTAVAAICSGETLAALPTTSNNGITGSWLPEINNSSTTTYTFTPSAGQCAMPTTLTVVVTQSPIINLAPYYYMCEGNTNALHIDTGLSTDHTFTWSLNNQALTSQEPYIDAVEAGEYEVTVTQNYGTVTCSTTAVFEVVMSSGASAIEVNGTDWTYNDNSISISASGNGNYEYSLDGIHFQDEPYFENLPAGHYKVYVRDKNGCGTATGNITLLNYPRYFTPNGDGENDLWHIEYAAYEPGIVTEIFDRYGKLIAVLHYLDGWDGTYNGHSLPATDYWFVVKRANGNIHKAHFSLLR
ncbi:T9SS type B sorting domain-containing protein [Flavobacterium akiainvivens]|uniref:T9SS type B sorting domain-containing protein n=1 Tax=Flavobacterium akiainvivens TaxID=1202724 RepID=UPI0008EDE912|nr:T9SS type B sorting domain-containing protein [Flavobacterium akiainvivens]SFQ63532.1 gliding motility-associated C-terminal domain-containing protein [Flavobacterium akiainvivens]